MADHHPKSQISAWSKHRVVELIDVNGFADGAMTQAGGLDALYQKSPATFLSTPPTDVTK